MYEERWYQNEGASAGVDSVMQGNNPVVVVPTGGGKTIIICKAIDEFLTRHPAEEILVLSHVKEILRQNAKALRKYFGPSLVEVWSAGLKSKEVGKITVAGIQSVHKNIDKFKHVGLVIVDECHLVSHKNVGMYRKFLKAVGAPVLGYTATHYRLGHGYIHVGGNTLFDTVAYNLTTLENFNRLVDEGYLCKIYSKKTRLKLNLDSVGTRANEYKPEDLSKAVDRETITDAAVHEIIEFGKRYKKWLIFAIDIEHAEHIAHKMNEYGVPCGVVHSKMEGDRDKEIKKLNTGEYRGIVNVDILTTGFDEPEIDLIALLRPTKSHSLHVQMIGRGLRIAPGKDHCLVLDFAGNTADLGPINDIKIENKKKKKGGGEQITKTCPECGVIHHPSVRVCDACDHEFEFKEKISSVADSEQEVFIAAKPGPVEKWVNVNGVGYSIHSKKGRPSSLKVTYQAGLSKISQWVCYDHTGYPKHLAKHWVKRRIDGTMPRDLKELYARRDDLMQPVRVLLRIEPDKKYPEIINYEWPDSCL